MNDGIIWLASFPKSGNTWFRIFLTNLLQDGESPADINALESTPIASCRQLFDEAVGFNSADLTAAEIDRLRPEVYEHLAATSEETLFMKVHDAYTAADADTMLFPVGASKGAIYFIRNPLDVAVSYAHHSHISCTKAVAGMGSDKTVFCDHVDRQHSQLRQKLLSWSNHVRSWVDGPLPVCVLRYEDMQDRPLETFERAVRFAGLQHSPEQIRKAITFSSFDELQRQEKEKGFKERSIGNENFFRTGIKGGWRGKLSSEDAGKVVRDHAEIMHRFGYLSSENDIIY